MKFKDSLERCHSLPLNLLKTHNYRSLSHLDTILSNKASINLKEGIDSTSSRMGKLCNSNIEANKSAISDKCNKLNIVLRNSIEGNTAMTTMISPSSEQMKGKTGKGYFYESVGGVYYSFGNSITEDKNSVSEDNKKECGDVDGIENISCDENVFTDKKPKCDNIVRSDNAKSRKGRRNLHTLSESSDKGEGDSGRQTCSSPISSEDNSNNDKHIFAIARCAANVASFPGILGYIFSLVVLLNNLDCSEILIIPFYSLL